MTNEEKVELIRNALKTKEGRMKLAQAMVQPIRGPRVDYPYRYICEECGMGWNDKGYKHSTEECSVYFVMDI